jgi:hypothetical protein
MLAAFGEKLMAMDRRSFVRGAGLSVAALASAMVTKAHAQVRAVDLTIDSNQKLATMPQDFIGLSYESAQLADPAFFSASDTTLVRAFRELSPRGVLQLGGNLSDVTLWKGSAANTIAPEEAAKVRDFYEWRLADGKAASVRPATLGREGIVTLGTFVGATQWKVLYGLNLGTGTAERAAEEAELAAHSLGDRLLAFQVGNEADLYGLAFAKAVGASSATGATISIS